MLIAIVCVRTRVCASPHLPDHFDAVSGSRQGSRLCDFRGGVHGSQQRPRSYVSTRGAVSATITSQTTPETTPETTPAGVSCDDKQRLGLLWLLTACCVFWWATAPVFQEFAAAIKAEVATVRVALRVLLHFTCSLLFPRLCASFVFPRALPLHCVCLCVCVSVLGRNDSNKQAHACLHTNSAAHCTHTCTHAFIRSVLLGWTMCVACIRCPTCGSTCKAFGSHVPMTVV